MNYNIIKLYITVLNYYILIKWVIVSKKIKKNLTRDSLSESAAKERELFTNNFYKLWTARAYKKRDRYQS